MVIKKFSYKDNAKRWGVYATFLKVCEDVAHWTHNFFASQRVIAQLAHDGQAMCTNCDGHGCELCEDGYVRLK